MILGFKGGVVMKANRNTIYITLFMTIVSALIYTYCIFGWNAVCITSSKWNTYISNLCLGIWGSSIISLFIGFTSYKESRKKCMERFIHASRKLFNHSALIRENNSKKWFDEYVDLYQELNHPVPVPGKNVPSKTSNAI